MEHKVKAIPEGFHTVTASLTLKDSRKALEFYKKAFGAKELGISPAPDGKGIMNAMIQVGDSVVMLGDEKFGGDCKSAESLGTSPVSLYLYVKDADAAFQKAVNAGAEVSMPMADMFWGDRSGAVKDPFGYTWMFATHTRDLSEEEIQKGAKAFFASMPGRSS